MCCYRSYLGSFEEEIMEYAFLNSKHGKKASKRRKRQNRNLSWVARFRVVSTRPTHYLFRHKNSAAPAFLLLRVGPFRRPWADTREYSNISFHHLICLSYVMECPTLSHQHSVSVLRRHIDILTSSARRC